MKPSRIIALTAGIVAGLVGLCALAGSLGLAVLSARRDTSGYLNSPSRRYSTDYYALTVVVPVAPGPLDASWARRLATVRVRAASRSGGPLFLGIATATQVDRWLGATTYDQVTNLAGGPPAYRHRAGSEALTPPGGQGFWAAHASGPGTQTLTWRVRPGTWELVVANADASLGIAVAASAGLRAPWLPVLAWVVGVVGLLLLAAGVATALVATRRPRSGPAPMPGGTPATLPRSGVGPLAPARWPMPSPGAAETPGQKGTFAGGSRI